jgi:hypothetical protein
MLAVSLGRMKAKQSVDGLKDFYQRITDRRPVEKNAAAWAVRQITKESLPNVTVVEQAYGNWFLRSE